MSGNGALPETGFLRLRQIVGDRKAKPPIAGPVPVSPSTWWQWVREGRAPKPLKLSRGVTVWTAASIRAYIEAAK